MAACFNYWVGSTVGKSGWGLLGLAVTLLSVPNAWALSRSELGRSVWDSHYETQDVGNSDARIHFQGSQGYFVNDGNRGQLSSIRYDVRSSGNATITGSFSYRGVRGQFTFFVAGHDDDWAFSGTWRANGVSRSWNGRLVQIASVRDDDFGGGSFDVGSDEDRHRSRSRQGVSYSRWQYDDSHDRYYCRVTYPSRDNPSEMRSQTVLWYADCPQRGGYYYFVNSQGQTWGRCVCPASPDYDPSTMQWSKLRDGRWSDLPDGDCPAPKDGDPQGAAINEIPDPPVG